MKTTQTLLTALILAFTTTLVQAQQIPLSSLYGDNLFMINPANAGDGEYLEAYLGTRNQWDGINGSPQTHYLSVHSGIGKSGSNIGTNLFYDRTELINTISASLVYAYDLTIAKEHNLSFGLGIGLFNTSLNLSNAVVQHADDQILANGDLNGFTIDGDFGIRYTWKGLEFGAAAAHLFETGPQFEKVSENYRLDLKRQYNFNVGYKIWLKDKTWMIHPSGMYRLLPGAPVQFDAGVRVGYKDIVWLGGMYRAETGPVASVGFNIGNKFTAAYAYDFSLNGIDQSLFSHEVMVGFKLGGFMKKFDQLESDMATIKQDNELLNGRTDSLEAKIASFEQDIERIDGTDRNQQEQLDSIQIEIDRLYNELNSLDAMDSTEIENLLKRLSPYIDADGNLSATEVDLESGYYVVIESFKSLENAYKGIEIWKKKGRDAIIVHDTERKWYYVYSQKYTNEREARKEMMKTRRKDVEDAWVHKYRVFD
ncbi:MAG: type IX secretion system PorP/SprF family membrane protein [Bacteroidia bacterium]|jgi:type IX secretion system PorP/SprF family membrane protein